MANRQRGKELSIIRRREQVSERYLRGEIISRIAEALGVGRATVHRDLKAIREEWHERAIANIDQRKSEELAKLHRIEREAALAWERSQLPEHTETCETTEPASGATESKSRTQVRGQCGNPKFLSEIRQCIELRARILGLFAPTKVAPTDPSGEVAYHDHVLRQLSDEELQTLEVVSERISQAAVS